MSLDSQMRIERGGGDKRVAADRPAERPVR